MKFFLFVFIFATSLLPETISNFAFLDFEGKNFILYKELEKLSSNEILVLNFMSSSCKPCKAEVPELLQISQENPNLKLVFIFVGDKNETAFSFIQEYKMQKAYKILFDRLEISFQKLGFKALPTTFVVQKNKILLKILTGYNSENLTEIKNLSIQK